MKKLWITFLLLSLMVLPALAEEIPLPDADMRIIERVDKPAFTAIIAQDAAGTPYLYVCIPGEDGTIVRRTNPLPEDAWLDGPHAGEDEIDLRGSGWSLTYNQQPDGDFLLASVVWMDMASDGWEDGQRYVHFCGLEPMGTTATLLQVGSVPGYDLFQADLQALCGNAPVLDRNGWAVVSAAEGLPLYADASENSLCLGAFFSGTPVQILTDTGDWLRVMIGTDGRVTGWMHRSGLTLGDGMDTVENRFPDLHYISAFDELRPLYTAIDRAECVEMASKDYWFWVVGETEDMYILLHRWGESGYVPKEWLFAGNG